MRRVSRGAQGIPNKFRRNGSNAQRDSSCGPVIMKRRSDSRGVTDSGMDISDLELEFRDEEAIEDLGDATYDLNNGPGNAASRSSVGSGSEAGVLAPIRFSILQQGTFLIKITRKKRKNIKFRLDFESAKVCWDPSRPSKQFYIDDVKEIRVGAEARNYREEFQIPRTKEPLWFTIIYSDPNRSKGRPFKTMHLIAPDEFHFNLWTNTLESVSRSRIDMMAGLVGTGEKTTKLVWRRAMDKKFEGVEHLEEEETMGLQGIIKLCRSLHINCTENSLRAHFEKADSDNSGVLTQAQFLNFVRRFKERKDIKHIHKSIKVSNNSELDKGGFFTFLRNDQEVDVDADLDYWTNIFEKYARASKPKATSPQASADSMPLNMSFSAFQAFLSSSANSCFAPAQSEPKFDRPLNEYFVSSSHNTYLLGRQVAGESSTEAYISVLQKGCRCIEIDCWDGSDGRPIVMHGRTLTKSILFADTIKVIAKYAFVSSPYPLIISLEVHCNPEQQAIMSEIMKKEFGDQLLLEPLYSDSVVLPSPEELKGKILIKVKAAAEDADEKAVANEITTARRQRSFSSPWSRPVILDNSAIPNSPLLSSPPSMSPPDRTGSFWTSPRTSTTSTNGTATTPGTLNSSAEDSDSLQVLMADEKKKKRKTSNIVKVLGELGVYTRGIKYSDFKNEDAMSYNHVFSFAERTFDKLCKPENDTKELLEEHNTRCLMRVYPSAHRINSSNFDPIMFWRRGVQMAALNWQTYDPGQQVNEAMFAAGNDRMGYVLKPEELRYDDASMCSHRKKPKKLVQFSVDIISAQQLPRPKGLSQDANINPYVEFEMYSAEDKGRGFATGVGGQDASARNGISGIGSPLRKRTQIIEANGYNPEFKETITMTLETRYPSLVFVRWTVWNSIDGRSVNSAPLATFTAKLSSLQQGYRHLPLFDANGEQYLFSTLFCRIKKMEDMPVDEHLVDRSLVPRGLVEPTSPLNEAVKDLTLKGGKGDFFKRVFSRTPSQRKKRKDSELLPASRSSTIEK